jgi:hypothetical protein
MSVCPHASSDTIGSLNVPRILGGHLLTRTLCGVWLLLTLGVGIPLTGEPTRRPADAGVVADGEVRNGVRLSVQIPDTRISPSKRIMVTLIVHNEGPDEIPFSFSRHVLGDIDLELTRNGEAVPLTEWGRQQKSIAPMVSSILSKLEPGERWSEPVDLSRLFDLSLEAEYELRVTRAMMNGDRISSGVLKFRVVDTATTTRPAHDSD